MQLSARTDRLADGPAELSRRSVVDMSALAIGLAIMAIPVLAELARNEWITDQGSQGPIMLVLGLWLAAREWPRRSVPARNAGLSFWRWLVPVLLSYVGARVTGQLWLAWVSVIACAALALRLQGGMDAVRKAGFALLFLALLVPPPGLLTGPVIDRLNPWLAEIAIGWFRAAGVEAASSGTMLYLGPYEMQITDACAGMGSLLSLVAIGLLYLHLRYPGQLGYALALVPLLIVIAIVANLLRIALLMLVTLMWGDGAAQGWFHPMAGLILFALALGGLILLDALLAPVRARLDRSGAGR